MTVDICIENGVGHITLNRPEALHALNTVMCQAILDALLRWRDDASVRFVMLDHLDGTRGFCAGGDIRALADSGRSDGVAGAAFFATEYRMNTALHHFPKPIIAFMDGVTMGGGVGISVHGSHRICTERTLFAMPETGIGLFPDVGGSWFLPRLKGQLGMWLALTGARLKGSDVVAAGLGTHYVSSHDLPALKAALMGGKVDLEVAIKSYERPVPDAAFAEFLTLINTCFDRDSVANICMALRHTDDEWAYDQGALLAKRSPFSMAVTHRAQTLGRNAETFDEVMRMEYRIASRIIKTHDFLEGVRSVILDKDHNPRWNPMSSSLVTPESVEALFAPLEHELDI